MTTDRPTEDLREEACFAQWMQAFARARGEQYLAENARLEADPEAAVPEALGRKNLALIHQTLRRRPTARRRSFLRHAAVLAAALIFMLATFSGAAASDKSNRWGTLDNLVFWDDGNFMTYRFLDAPPADPVLTPVEVSFGWLPDGYAVTQYDLILNRDRWILLENDAGGRIDLFVSGANGSTTLIDSEDTDSKTEVTVQGCSALLVLKNDLYRLSWADPWKTVFVHMESPDVDGETLLKLGENLRIKSPYD